MYKYLPFKQTFLTLVQKPFTTFLIVVHPPPQKLTKQNKNLPIFLNLVQDKPLITFLIVVQKEHLPIFFILVRNKQTLVHLIDSRAN